MKIIFSPSKTQKVTVVKGGDFSKPLFPEKTKELLLYLQSLTKDDFQKILKISEQKSEEVFNIYNNFQKSEIGHAFVSFTGTSFSMIDFGSFVQTDWDFAEKHVCILSALYGVLQVFSSFRVYRLDLGDALFKFTKKTEYKNLYDFWEREINNYFEKEETILNVASKEYSKILNKENQRKMITVDFLVEKEGKRKSVSVYSKQQRGKMLSWVIKNKITVAEDLKKYSSDGFVFDKGCSSKQHFVFYKNIR